MTVAPPHGSPAIEGLDPPARESLAKLVELLSEPRSPTSVRDPERAWKVHVADSLSGIEPGGLDGVERIADIGAGAGLPGLVLAIVFPETQVDLIEATSRKAEFIARAAAELGLENASAIDARAETWAGGEGRERYDAATARAVGRLATLAELASPLLADGGRLVCWKGKRDSDEEAELGRAAPELAVEPVSITPVGPWAGSRHRHIHLLRKNGPTPDGLPRRPGIAKKRPFGSEPGRRSAPDHQPADD